MPTTNLLSITIEQMPLIVIATVSLCTLGLMWLTREITFHGTDTDNEKQAAAAATISKWKFPSDMHKHANGKASMKDVVILLLAICQKLFRDKSTDKPLVWLCLISNAISALLIFAIASRFADPLLAGLVTILFFGSFWPHQIALFGGHICIAQMIFISSTYFLIAAQNQNFSEAVLNFSLGGICFALTSFASSSARKFIPITIATLLWSLYTHSDSATNIILMLAAYLFSMFATFFIFLYPNFSQNISHYFYYWNAPKHFGHFMLYKDHFARIGKPISDTMRGAGVPWLEKFCSLFIPVHTIIYFLTAFAALAISAIYSPSQLFITLVVLILSLSPTLWAEISSAPQLSRSYLPSLSGIILTLTFCGMLIDQYFHSFYNYYLIFLLVAAVASTLHSFYVFFVDVLPARMAPTWAARTLKQLGVTEFYTYDTPYNHAFVDCMPTSFLSSCKRISIKSLNEVSGGIVLIPGVSSKALNMESEPWALSYGEFSLDLTLNGLLKNRKISTFAKNCFKTFGTSKIWVHESEASSHRAFITEEINEEDLWRGHAWILDGAKLASYFKEQRDKFINSNSKDELVSILIPTLNRPDFVIRLLRYYKDTNFKGFICIADSSTPSNFSKVSSEISSDEKYQKVIHLKMPGKHAGQCLKEMIEFCPTPYVAFTGDDDYFIPNGLARCVEYLEARPDYAAVHGESICVTLDRPGHEGIPINAVHYPQPLLESDDPSQRLGQLLNGYGVTLFSVHRIDFWREAFQEADAISDKAFREELLPVCITTVLGKIGSINALSLIRQNHDARYALEGDFDWISKRDWGASYQRFSHAVARELGMRMNVPMNDAIAFIRNAFSTYLSINLARQCLKADINTPFTPVANTWNLDTVMQPGGLFYEEFRPVYKSLIGA